MRTDQFYPNVIFWKMHLSLLSPFDKRDLKLRKKNVQSLKAIQNVFSVEEDQILSLDEVMARVLEFYRKFVPYK